MEAKAQEPKIAQDVLFVIEMVFFGKTRAAVLAGVNLGKAKQKEEKDKALMEKKGYNRFLRGYKVLTSQLKDSHMSVLDCTLDSIVDNEMIDTKNSFILGDREEILKASSGKGMRIIQQSDSLGKNVLKAIDILYEDGYQDRSIIMCADISAAKKEDISDFLQKAYSKKSDLVFGLGDLDELKGYFSSIEELKDTGKLGKFGITFIDDIGLTDKETAKITFGSTYLVSRRMFECKETYAENLSCFLDAKRLLKDPRNIPKIAYVVGLKNLYRVISKNILKGAASKKSLSLSEVESSIENRIFDGKIKVSAVKLHPRVVSDVDDYNDLERNASIIKNNY